MDEYTGAALAVTYSDMLPAVRHLIKKFIRRYGGDYEEFMSICTLEFVRVFLTYHDVAGLIKQAPFDWWVKFKLHKRLLGEREKELRHARILPTRKLEEEDWEVQEFALGREDPKFFDLEDFIAALGPDEDTAVRLAIEQPVRVKHYAKKFADRSIGNPGYGTGNGQAVGIKKYLRRNYGWSKHKIRDAWESVREKL